MTMTMTRNDQTLSRARRLGRRVLTLGALALLVGSLAEAALAPSVALADRATPPARVAPTDASPTEPPTASPGKAAPTGKVDLNNASEAELETLPGVGPAKSERIVAYRTKNGPFKRIADLRRVKGFGKKTVDRLTPMLVLGAKTGGARP